MELASIVIIVFAVIITLLTVVIVKGSRSCIDTIDSLKNNNEEQKDIICYNNCTTALFLSL